MDQTQNLQQTMRRFESEMDRLIMSSFVDLPASLEVLLDALDSEPLISRYLRECTGAHVPEGFDATAEMRRVADSASEVFGPFPTDDHQAAAGEAYLVLQEMLRRRIRFHDPIFMGYVDEPARPHERFGAFKADVIMRLIDDVTAWLEEQAAEAGIDRQAGTEIASEPAPAKAVSAGGFSEERLAQLLAELADATDMLPDEDREDARLQLEALRDELTGRDAKKSVVKVLMRALRLIGSVPAWRDAVDRLDDCLQVGGLV